MWPHVIVRTLVDRPPYRPGIGPGSFQNRDRCRATVPVHLETATVPVHVGQWSRLVVTTGTNAPATNTWRTAGHWSRLLAPTGTVALCEGHGLMTWHVCSSSLSLPYLLTASFPYLLTAPAPP